MKYNLKGSIVIEKAIEILGVSHRTLSGKDVVRLRVMDEEHELAIGDQFNLTLTFDHQNDELEKLKRAKKIIDDAIRMSS